MENNKKEETFQEKLERIKKSNERKRNNAARKEAKLFNSLMIG